MQNFISSCDGPAKAQEQGRDGNARKEQLMADKEGKMTPLHQLHYTHRAVF